MSGNKTDGTEPGSELFAQHKVELPGEWHETFDALTAQGKSPSGIKATIEYVTTPKTQKEVSAEFNVSDVTIRTLQAAVIALGPIDERRAAQHSSSRHTQMDFCNHVADRLGWEEGLEYSVSSSGYSSTPQPTLRSEGWRSLFETIVDQADSSQDTDT